MHLFAEIQ